MQEIINNLLQNADGIVAAMAAGIATLLVLAIKYLFAFAQNMASKTSTAIDEKLVDETKQNFKNKIKDI